MGRSLSHRSARPLLPASILGPPPPGDSRLRLPRLRSRPESPRPRSRPGRLRGAAPVRSSNGAAFAPSAPGRLPREGARPPPRLHPLGGAAAIWGPCQSRPLRGRAELARERLSHRRPPAGAARRDAPRVQRLRAEPGWKRVAADAAPLANSVTLREPGPEPRRRRWGPRGWRGPSPNVRGGRRLRSLGLTPCLPPLPPSPPRAGRRK